VYCRNICKEYMHVYKCIHIILCIQGIWKIFRIGAEWTKLRRKVLYHFAIFAIINKILIAKNYRKLTTISSRNNYFEKSHYHEKSQKSCE